MLLRCMRSRVKSSPQVCRSLAHRSQADWGWQLPDRVHPRASTGPARHQSACRTGAGGACALAGRARGLRLRWEDGAAGTGPQGSHARADWKPDARLLS
ncbi:hypothetical protein VULLAG_LOCUS1451 [Vulpes lagopus]